MFFDINPAKYNLDKKWNISNFVSNSVYKTASGKTVNGKDVQSVDLLKAIANIEKDSLKLEKEYDQIYREMVLKRNQLKKTLDIMEAQNAKYQDIASMHGIDVQLMRNQLAVIESKQKLKSEKYKNIRDERKSYEVKSSDSDNQNTQQVIVANSPLAVAQAVRPGNIAPITYSAPASQSVITHNPVTEDEVLKAVKEQTKSLETADVVKNDEVFNMGVEPTERSSSNDIDTIKEVIQSKTDTTPIKKDMFNRPVETMSDKALKNLDIIKSRLEHEDELLERPNMLEHSYKRSLDNIEAKNTPHKVVLYINPDSGQFYEKAFTLDSAGEYTVPYDVYHPRSVTHLGSLDIDAKNKMVTTYFGTEPIEFRIDRNDYHVPEFYENEWSDSKNDKYLLPDNIKQILNSMYPEDDE